MKYPVIKPPYEEDYEVHWKDLNVSSKVILDIGSDYGSTASFFLNKGARKIIAFDQDAEAIKKLTETFSNYPEVIPLVGKICSGKQLSDLIKDYRPDIVKVDIEGDEIFLTTMNLSVMKLVNLYAVEIHTPVLKNLLTEFFTNNEFEILKEFPYLQLHVMYFRLKES